MELKNPFTNGKVIGSVTTDVYRRQEVPRGDPAFIMSRGELMEFNRCPHRWLAGIESDETKSTEWGSLLDCLVLTPERFGEQFAVAPEKYESKGMQCPSCGSVTDAKTCRACKTDRVEIKVEKDWDWNATACKDWRAEREGKAIVKHQLSLDASAAVKVLLADPQIAALIACSGKQVMVMAEYHDAETGLIVPFKILLDLVPESFSQFGQALADLKSCVTASPFPWTRAVFEHGYHTQAAVYTDIWNVASGDERIEFLHVLQENYAPWEVGKRILSAEYLELGRGTYVTALQRYCQCLAANQWPGYDDGRNALNGWTLTEPEPYMIGR